MSLVTSVFVFALGLLACAMSSAVKMLLNVADGFLGGMRQHPCH